MAVLKMQKISIYALKNDRKTILELLQRRGAIEISDLDLKNPVFSHMDTRQNQGIFEKNLQTVQQAISILESYSEEKKSIFSTFEGRKPITLKEYQEGVEICPSALKAASQITALKKEIVENQAELIRLESQLDGLSPWLNLDIPMQCKGTKSTVIKIGTLPELWSLEDILAELAKYAPEVSGVSVEIISATEDQTCIFVVCEKSVGPMIEDALRSLGFAYPSTLTAIPPKEQAEALRRKEKELQEQIGTAEKEIRSFLKQIDQLKFTVDYLLIRIEKYGALGHLAQSKHVFIVTGYIPEREAERIERELTASFTCEVELETPGSQEEVPVALSNNRFAEPVEPVLESYNMVSNMTFPMLICL